MYPTDSNILHNRDCSASSTTAIAISGGLVGGAAVLFIDESSFLCRHPFLD